MAHRDKEMDSDIHYYVSSGIVIKKRKRHPILQENI